MSLDHLNHGYDGGSPNLTLNVGDRYYSQDLGRDFWFLYGAFGNNIQNLYSAYPVLVKDSYVEKGSDFEKVDIPIAGGVVDYDVTVPDSFASIPPTTKTETAKIYVETTAQSDFNISGTATLDGATTNYLKVTYDEANGSSRNKAKKIGSYNYEVSKSFVITCDSVAPSDYDLVLAEIVGDGATTMTIIRYTRTPIKSDGFDYIVSSQDDFNQIVTRVAANQYKIIDSVKSVYFRNLSGGYAMYGATSFLEGGDTWGYIETNNCQHIEFEKGAYLYVEETQGYIKANTDDGLLRNVYLKGLGTTGSPATLTYSFLLNANRVTFENCQTSNRKSSDDLYAFKGSATASHNETSNYINCIVHDMNLQIADRYGMFRDCDNLINCKVTDITVASGIFYFFYNCKYIKNCLADTISSPAQIQGFRDCDNAIDCISKNISSSGSVVYGFVTSDNIRGCKCITINSSADSSYGFYGCFYPSNCQSIWIEHNGAVSGKKAYGFSSCYFISSCFSNAIISDGDEAIGFYDCDGISSCRALLVSSSVQNAYGYNACNYISSCTTERIDHDGSVADKSAYGFYVCNYLSSCYANDIDTNGGGSAVAHGYNTCTRITTSKAENCNDGFKDCDYLISCFSGTNSRYGFWLCDSVVSCQATGNTYGFITCIAVTVCKASGNSTAQYSNTYADWGGTQTAADTATGGYNG